MNLTLKPLLSTQFVNLADTVLANDALRSLALKFADRKLYHHIVEENITGRPHKVQEDKYYVLRNMFYSIDCALERETISPAVRKSVLKNLIGNVIMEDNATKRAFTEPHGFAPPNFLLISPTKRCNLQCVGCYACSSSVDAEKLDYDTIDRIMKEKRELWGSYFTVISGGEPLMWRD